jgi:hypothetical protein
MHGWFFTELKISVIIYEYRLRYTKRLEGLSGYRNPVKVTTINSHLPFNRVKLIFNK